MNNKVVEWLCIGFLALLVVAAILAPWIAPKPPGAISLGERLRPPALFAGRTATNVLGSDNLGRDILTRVLYRARISLMVAFIKVVISGAAGTLIGHVAGYYRGPIDTL